MKNILLHHSLASKIWKPLALTFMLFLISLSGFSQLDCDTTGCNAKEFWLVEESLFIGDINGNPFEAGYCNAGIPDTVTAYIYGKFGGNTVRYSLFASFDIYINDTLVETKDTCLFYEMEIQMGTNVALYEYDWVCGDELELRNIYLSWQTNGGKSTCGCASAKCYFTAESFLVRAPLIADFDYKLNCEIGDSIPKVTFTDASTGGYMPDATYSWTFDGDAIPSSSFSDSVIVTYLTSGPKIVNLSVIDTAGFTDLITKTIEVKSCCDVSPTISSNGTTICEGDLVTFTAGGGAKFNFLLNGNSVQNGIKTTYETNTLSTFDEVKVVVTDIYSCTDTSSTITITVVETPEVDDMQDVSACDFYVLPEIKGTNLTGQETYIEQTYIAPITYSEGDTIWMTTRLYIYDETNTNPSCKSEEDFLITIDTTPDVFDITDTIVCEEYILPAVPGNNLTDRAGYYSGPYAGLPKYSPGTLITYTTTLYIYDETDSDPNCWDQEEFTITVMDTTNPSFTVPSDISIYKNDTCGFVATVDVTGDVTNETDNCDTNLDATFEDEDITGEECIGKTILLRTWTLEDARGNDTIQTQTITVLDTTSPTFTVPSDITVYKDDTCGYVAKIDVTGDVTDETDNCSIEIEATFTDSLSEGSCADELLIERTWKLVDDCENITKKIQIITVKDTIAPVVNCDADGDRNLYLYENCEVILPSYIDTASITDNCTNPEDLSIYQIPEPGTMVSGSESPFEVWIYAEDDCSNIDSCSVTITLTDTIPPMVKCPGNDSIPLNENCVAIIPEYTFNFLSDNCTDSTAIIVSQLPVSGTAITENTTVTLYAEDLTGNKDSCSFDVIPYALKFDVINCPADTTIYVDENCETGIPELSPNILFASCSEFTNSYTWEQSPSADSIVGVGTYTVILNVFRVQESVKTCNVNITVLDTIPPAINCPEDDLVAVDENCAFTLEDYTSQIEVTDNCTATDSITLTQRPAAGTIIEGHGTEQVVWVYAEDTYLNIDSCSFTITLQDTLPPIVSCPADQEIPLNDVCEISIPTFNFTDVSDNCSDSVNIVVTQMPIAGTVVTDTTLITLFARDEAGNVDSCSFNVIPTISDSTSIVCPSDIIAGANENCEYTIPALDPVITPASCTDLDNFNVIQTPVEGTVIGLGITSVTIEVFEGEESIKVCTVEITVQDSTPPAISCPEDDLVAVDKDCTFTLEDYTSQIEVTDNCTATDSITLTQRPAAGTIIEGHGTEQVVWVYAEDTYLNIDSCSFTITLQDTLPPIVSCPADQEIPLNDVCEISIPTFNFTDVSDNCSDSVNIVVTQMPIAGTVVTDTTLITLFARDEAGNVDSCSFNVIPTISDSTTIVCPPDIIAGADENCEFTIPALDPVITPASCTDPDNFNVIQTPVEGTVIGLGITSVTIEVFEGEESIKVCTVEITVQDSAPPSISCPEDDLVAVDKDCTFTLEDYTSQVEVSDNCTVTDLITLTQSPAAGTIIEGHGTEQVVWIYAEDSYQNIDSCSFTITLEDIIPPLVECRDDQKIQLNNECEVLIPSFDFESSSDNCTETENLVVTQSPVAGTVITETTKLTLTATDEAGNSSSCSYNVIPTKSDVTTVVCPADIEADADENCEYIIPELNPVINPASCTEIGNFNVVQTPVARTVIGIGNTSVTIEVFEGEELIETCNVDLSIVDNTIDVNCPDDVTLEADTLCQAELPNFIPEVEITENCTDLDDVEVTQNPVAGTLVSTGITEVTITVRDESGNTSTCSVDVTVEDNTNPTIVCPANIELEAQAGICEANAVVEAPVVDDNCQVDSVVNDYNNTANASGVYPVGETKVIWTVTDVSGNTAECAMKVTVIPAPLAIDDNVKTLENTPIDINILANDLDCDDLDNTTIVIVEDPANGTVTIIPGSDSVTYTPNDGFDGTDEFVYRVCNTSGLCDTAVVTIVIDNTNNPPVAENDINVTDINTPVDGNVLTNDSDPDGDPITSTKLTDPSNGTVTLNPDGRYTYTPANGFVGTDNFDYVACDNGGLCDTATVTIEVVVTTPNSVVAMDDNTSGKVNTPVTGNVLENDFDPENDNIILNTTPVTQPANGSVTINADGTFEYIPNQDFVGVDQFTYQICDDNAIQACDIATVIIHYFAQGNLPPLAENDINSTLIDTPVYGDVQTNDMDPDGDALTTTKLTDPGNGTVTLNPDGTYTYTPNTGFISEDTFDYIICDNGGLCDTATVFIAVVENPILEGNRPPEIIDDNTRGKINSPVTGNLISNDFDPDGDLIFINTTPITAPESGTLTINSDGTFTFVPETDFTGVITFEYEICDNGDPVLCDIAMVTIEIEHEEDVNTTFAVDDMNQAFNLGEAIPGNVSENDYDAEGNSQTFTLVTGPFSGLLVFNSDGTFEFTPNEDFSGSESFIYMICDNGTPQACDIATVYLLIEDPLQVIPLDPIVPEDDYYTATCETLYDDVLTNDEVTIDEISIPTIVEDVKNGTLVFNVDGTFEYTANTDFIGMDSFSYQICWAEADTICGPATVYIDVIYDKACYPCPDLFIPDGFSPNGDGNHDHFVVECIEDLYPDARLIIFNRWGNLIYEKENYGNTSVWDETEAFWDGKSQHNWTVGEEKVPIGTYMYVLILNKETVRKGTIYLNY